jgi:predicted P-loop ATPase
MSFRNYIEEGLSLCAIDDGKKAPTYKGWNTKPIPLDAVDGITGAGLLHALSETCALDVDSLKAAQPWLADRGVDLQALLDADDALILSSGRPDRTKLIYRMKRPLRTVKPKDSGLELRCATADGKSVQDVLPPTIHPDTKKPYVWAGGILSDWRNPPTIPPSLLALWRELAEPIVTDVPAPADKPKRVIDLFKLRKAAFKHDPNCDHDEWLRVGMQLHDATGAAQEGLDIWDDWSKTATRDQNGKPGVKVYQGKLALKVRYVSFGPAPGKRVATGAALVGELPAEAEDFEIIEKQTVPDDRTTAQLPALVFTRRRRRVLPTIANVATALRAPEWCHFDLAFDTFRDEIVVAPHGTEEWGPLGDDGTTRIMEQFERASFLPIAREVMRQTLAMVANERKFDSAIRWLESLKWDGVPRVGKFLSEYCGAEDSPYTRAVSRYLWSALAGRVLEPGCKADMVPILVGRQGAKKTSAVAALVPSPDYFTEVNLTERDEDLSRKMRGRLVGEIGELRGLSTRDLESIKTFITRRDEDWIPKYKEFATRFPRRLVFIGTTNSREFLADDTGHRRWLPVEVDVSDVERIKTDRLQLWAEGAVLWAAGGIAWREAEELAPAVHQKHVVSDSWEALISRWLDDPDELGRERRRARPFNTSEVMGGALSMSPSQMTRANEMRVAKVLRFMGFDQRITKSNGKSTRVWTRA